MVLLHIQANKRCKRNPAVKAFPNKKANKVVSSGIRPPEHDRELKLHFAVFSLDTRVLVLSNYFPPKRKLQRQDTTNYEEFTL